MKEARQYISPAAEDAQLGMQKIICGSDNMNAGNINSIGEYNRSGWGSWDTP